MGACNSHEAYDYPEPAIPSSPTRSELDVPARKSLCAEDSIPSDDNNALNAEIAALISSCKLIRYGSSGYIRETYRSGVVQSGIRPEDNPSEDMVPSMSSIIYLIDRKSTCFWTTSKSDQVHFYHGGSGLYVDLIDPEGNFYEDVRLGVGTSESEQLEFIPQIIVPAGWFKRYRFTHTDTYCLFGGALRPGRNNQTEDFVKIADLRQRLKYHQPTLVQKLCHFCHDFTPGADCEGRLKKRKKRKYLSDELQRIVDRKILNVHE